METITQKEWKETSKDYKTIINGIHYVLKLESTGTCLVPVEIVKEKIKRQGEVV